MKYGEIDKLIGKYMKSNFHSGSERRCYFELERKDPKTFKGYGERNGLMYLADVMNCYYVDVFIKPKTENAKETEGSIKFGFREDDKDLMNVYLSFKDFEELHMKYFISLIWEYLTMEKRWVTKSSDFSNGVIAQDFIRDNKIDNIVT